MPVSLNQPPYERALARIGSTVQQKYRINRLLGVGGMAAVYAASHRNGHRVAIKFLLDHLRHDPDVYRLFNREAYIANEVGHPGAVSVLDDDIDEEGCVFLIMPLLVGETLRVRWERAGNRLPLAEVGILMLDVLDVLASAHANGIVHRDIKPDNLFVTTKGQVHVLDFGIARRVEIDGNVSVTGRAMGTPAFMPPEQALGERTAIGPHSDCWAVGATIFSLLSGQFVHRGNSANAQLVASATKPARPLAEVLPDLPPAMCRFLDRALAFEPAERWASGREMHDALLSSLAESLGEDVSTVAARVRAGVVTELAPKSTSLAETKRSGVPTEAIPIHPELSTLAPAKASVADAEPTMQAGRLPDLPRPPTSTETSLSPAAVAAAPRSNPLHARRGSMTWATTIGIAVALTATAGTITYRSGKGQDHLDKSANLAVEAARNVEKNPEEEAILDGAIQLWTDGASGLAQAEFARAAARAPMDPRPHVFFVLASEWIDTDAREHARLAIPMRARLGEIYAGLFEAIQPLVTELPNLAESTRRFEDQGARYPRDRVVQLARASHYLRTRETRKAFQLASTPELSGNVARWLAARAHLLEGDVAKARPLLRACIDASPGALDCLTWLALVEANEGNCATAETIARKSIAVSPDNHFGYGLLGRAVMGQTHSSTATRAVLQSRWEHAPVPYMRLSDETFLHVYDGDFSSAYRDLDAWDAAVKSSTDAFERSYPLEWRIELDLELGRIQEASSNARALAFGSHAWLPTDWFNTDIAVARALYLTSEIPREQFLRERGAAVEKEQAKAGYYSSLGTRWIESYVDTIRVPEDVETTLAAQPATHPLVDPLEQDDGVDAPLGHLWLLAGRVDDAVVALRRAVASCQYAKPEYHVRAYLWLGQALERTHDIPGACEAYAEVLSRWGREPRSITARTARGRFNAICSKQPSRGTP